MRQAGNDHQAELMAPAGRFSPRYQHTEIWIGLRLRWYRCPLAHSFAILKMNGALCQPRSTTPASSRAVRAIRPVKYWRRLHGRRFSMPPSENT